jgi:hypothetical protein
MRVTIHKFDSRCSQFIIVSHPSPSHSRSNNASSPQHQQAHRDLVELGQAAAEQLGQHLGLQDSDSQQEQPDHHRPMFIITQVEMLSKLVHNNNGTGAPLPSMQSVPFTQVNSLLSSLSGSESPHQYTIHQLQQHIEHRTAASSSPTRS